jgi:methylglutaconyl-CoA hydratase
MMATYQDDRGFVNSEVDEHGIAQITFYHPSHNSFPRKQLEKLAAKIDDLSEKEEVKLILLQSEGNRSFCAGASFDELLTIKTREAGKEFFSGFALVINAIRSNKKLVICKVQGKAIGGGMGLAAACDYCFATEHASIRLSELGVNMGPFVIAPAVERKIGLSAFTMLTLNPDEYKDAQWAKAHGLFQEVYPDLGRMEEAVQAFCRRLSGYNRKALTEIKSVLWHDTDHWDKLLFERADISGKLVLSEETKASLLAFKNRK